MRADIAQNLRKWDFWMLEHGIVERLCHLVRQITDQRAATTPLAPSRKKVAGKPLTPTSAGAARPSSQALRKTKAWSRTNAFTKSSDPSITEPERLLTMSRR